MINYVSVISPELVVELYNQGFRPPKEAKSGQVWYDPRTKYYLRFEDGDKATQFSNEGRTVNMDLLIPKDLTNLLYSPTEFELNEYLSDWACTFQNGDFTCQNKNDSQKQVYQAHKEVDALAKTWIGERIKMLPFETCQRLKKKGFPQPEMMLETFWYDEKGTLVKVDLIKAREGTAVGIFWHNQSNGSWSLITGEKFDKYKAYFAPSIWSVLHELKAGLEETTNKPLAENYTLDECVERWLEVKKEILKDNAA